MENIENKIPNGENQDTQNSSFFSENVSSSNGLEAKLPYIKFSTSQWQQKNFSDLFTILSNNTHSRAELTNYGTIRNIHYGDVLIKFGNILDTSQAEIPYLCENCKYKDEYMQDGDIIIADTAEDYTAGKCTELFNVGTSKIISGLHTIPCRPKIKFAQKYLGYYTNSPAYRHQLLSLLQGIKVYSISKTNLSNTHVSYPPLPEQQKIADFLSLVDQRIEKQRQLVESLKKYKRGLVFHLFNKNNPINKSIPMRDLLTEINDRNSVGLRVCSVAVIKGIVDQIEHLGRSFSASDTSKYRRVHFGDVVYTKSPTGDFPFGIVKQSKIKEDVAVSPLYGVYKPSSYSTGNLLHLYFEQYQYANNYIRSLAQKGAKNTINITTQHFLEKNIIFPYNEVDRVYFSNFFEKLNKLIKFNEGELEKAQSLKKGLLQQMFI